MRLRDRRIQTSYPVRLTCQAIGFPSPDITWYKNSVAIIQNGELHITIKFTAVCINSIVS